MKNQHFFRQINVFIKEVTKVLISQNFAPKNDNKMMKHSNKKR